jgi:hypothetical protein
LGEADLEEKLNAEAKPEMMTEFLKFSITHLEGRIKLVEGSASIFLGILTGLQALLGLAVSKFFWIDGRSILDRISLVFLAIEILCAVATMLMLIRTIRPSRTLLGTKIQFVPMQVDPYVFWFSDSFPNSAENYRAEIEKMSERQILDNYRKAHFTSLQLIRDKYRFYRQAVVALRITLLWSALGLTGLSLLRLV